MKKMVKLVVDKLYPCHEGQSIKKEKKCLIFFRHHVVCVIPCPIPNYFPVAQMGSSWSRSSHLKVIKGESEEVRQFSIHEFCSNESPSQVAYVIVL